MYIVYHDVDGAHSAVIAAAVHLHQLPMDHIPTKSEILRIPLFDRIEKDDLGRLIYQGKDEYNHFVYTIGRQYAPEIVMNAIQTVFDMAGRSKKEILCVDTSPSVNNFIRIGGGSSRKLGLVILGRPILTHGMLKAYPKIVEIVKKTKLKIAP